MDPKLIVVTAASSNHFGALRQMLESLRRLDARVECYDIGLTSPEAGALPRWDGFFYHKFDYARHPPHLDVTVNAGEYAWKPVIVAEVVERSRTGPDRATSCGPMQVAISTRFSRWPTESGTREDCGSGRRPASCGSGPIR